MRKRFFALVRKDFRMMLSGRFFLLALGSFLLYSCYINFFYVKLDQDIYPVCLYDPAGKQRGVSDTVITADSRDELHRLCADGYSVGIDMSGDEPEIYLVTSGSSVTDQYRLAYAASSLSGARSSVPQTVGRNDREMKNRREITCEFLFFELTAVGFLGIASLLFKEKQMGVIRVHSILPVNITAFILSKLFVFLLADLLFAAALTLLNLGWSAGIAVLPAVLTQAGLLSAMMASAGFLLAVLLSDFKKFSLCYLVIAVFISTPVFIAGQTGISWSWMKYHPVYHLFLAMKNAYFETSYANGLYYVICAAAVSALVLLVRKAIGREMTGEG